MIGSVAVVTNEKNVVSAYKVNGKELVQEITKIEDKET